MKLFPILFLNEEMRNGNDALANNLAASFQSSRITLFDPMKLKEFLKEQGDIEADDYNTIYKAVKGESKIIVGSIDYWSRSGLSLVSTSAAIDGFGPLMYQLAMYKVNPNFLACDTTLKPASLKVWQKMFEFSNKGVYERSFLRLYGKDMFINRIDIHDGDSLRKYLQETDGDPSEETFLSWLKKHNLNPTDFGFLWAYRKKDFDSSFGQLLSKGEQAANEIKDGPELIRKMGVMFFEDLYGSEASYSEE